MADVSSRIAKHIRKLIEDAQAVMGLTICFHDRLGRSGLPSHMVQHYTPLCRQHKNEDDPTCTQFDVREVHIALAGQPEGRIHVCPRGLTEIAVPVMTEGLFAGVLFAGQCWMRKSRPPHTSLVRPPDRKWLQVRLTLLRALAARLGELLAGEERYVPQDRRQQILAFITDRMEHALSLTDLAQALRVSVSRAGHIVKEIFAVTFPELVRSIKMQEAAFLLASTDHPIGMVAQMVGFHDQSYFTSVFSRHFQRTPRQYRRRYSTSA